MSFDEILETYSSYIRHVAWHLTPNDNTDFYQDIMQCGRMGLWKAYSRKESTDPDFHAYAKGRIQSEMKDELRARYCWSHSKSSNKGGSDIFVRSGNFYLEVKEGHKIQESLHDNIVIMKEYLDKLGIIAYYYYIDGLSKKEIGERIGESYYIIRLRLEKEVV